MLVSHMRTTGINLKKQLVQMTFGAASQTIGRVSFDVAYNYSSLGLAHMAHISSRLAFCVYYCYTLKHYINFQLCMSEIFRFEIGKRTSVPSSPSYTLQSIIVSKYFLLQYKHLVFLEEYKYNGHIGECKSTHSIYPTHNSPNIIQVRFEAIIVKNIKTSLMLKDIYSEEG